MKVDNIHDLRSIIKFANVDENLNEDYELIEKKGNFKSNSNQNFHKTFGSYQSDNNNSDDFKEKIPITVYLKNDTKKIEIEQLIKKLNLKDYTNSINYISKEKGAEILINEIGEDFIEFYGTNPLLNSIDVFLKSEFVTTLVFDEISNELNNTDFIDEIIYDAPLVSLINDNINRIKYWILGIAMFFLIISILVINSSIRLSIYSNRINIKTMQMVGATRRFIRKPFISTHVKLGLIGSLTAITLLSSSLYYIQNNFEYFNFEPEIPLIILMFAAISTT